jgi:hypothetical protein
MAGSSKNLTDEVDAFSDEFDLDPDNRNSRDSRDSKTRESRIRFKKELAYALQWVSIALIGSFFITLIGNILPIQLMKPEWLDKLITSIRSGASFPLYGAISMMLARIFAPNDQTLIRRLRLVRRFAALMSIVFLLIIPLQIFAGLKIIGNLNVNENQGLAALQKSAAAIEKATTELEFRAALSIIPDVPPIPASAFNQPIPVLKANFLRQLIPQIKRRETLIAEQKRNRTELFLSLSLRDILLSLLYALGFGAIAKRSFFLNFSN